MIHCFVYLNPLFVQFTIPHPREGMLIFKVIMEKVEKKSSF
ncbi:hypothetical protein ZORO111902_19000 [Zobellia roscoffensis]